MWGFVKRNVLINHGCALDSLMTNLEKMYEEKKIKYFVVSGSLFILPLFILLNKFGCYSYDLSFCIKYHCVANSNSKEGGRQAGDWS